MSVRFTYLADSDDLVDFCTAFSDVDLYFEYLFVNTCLAALSGVMNSTGYSNALVSDYLYFLDVCLSDEICHRFCNSFSNLVSLSS